MFTDLPRSSTSAGVAGKIMTGRRALELLDEGCDFVLIGRAVILEPEFSVRDELDYDAPAPPVSVDFLKDKGLFINYMAIAWDGFVVRTDQLVTRKIPCSATS
jgi:hypothetical protein